MSEFVNYENVDDYNNQWDSLADDYSDGFRELSRTSSSLEAQLRAIEERLAAMEREEKNELKQPNAPDNVIQFPDRFSIK